MCQALWSLQTRQILSALEPIFASAQGLVAEFRSKRLIFEFSGTRAEEPKFSQLHTHLRLWLKADFSPLLQFRASLIIYKTSDHTLLTFFHHPPLLINSSFLSLSLLSHTLTSVLSADSVRCAFA